MVIRKNWIEKGIRDELRGSKPHSNGEFFSRVLLGFFDRINVKVIIIKEIQKIIKDIINKLMIIYTT